MSAIFNIDDQIQAEERLDAFVNSLNSMRDGSSNPAKVDNKIKQVRNELKFIRDEFPESEYCDIRNVMFGMYVIEHFNLQDLL